MTTALVSLLTGRPVDREVAMTGEVTLSGRVLPIGGLQQKLLAAHRAGLATVTVAHGNAPDLDDAPQDVRDALDIRLAADVSASSNGRCSLASKGKVRGQPPGLLDDKQRGCAHDVACELPTRKGKFWLKLTPNICDDE